MQIVYIFIDNLVSPSLSLPPSCVTDLLFLLLQIQVLEESGFDVTKLLNKDEYIELVFGQQRVRLYIIAGVKDDTAFAPQTKKEISVCNPILF